MRLLPGCWAVGPGGLPPLCAVQHWGWQGPLAHGSVQGIAPTAVGAVRGLGDLSGKMIRFTFPESHMAA